MSLPLVCVLALGSTAGADVITFEELGPQPPLFLSTNPLSGEYPGVFFTGPSEGDGGAILHHTGNFGILPHSGEHFFAFNETTTLPMQNGGFPKGPETIIFSDLMSYVEIYAAGGSGIGAEFLMQAFDDNGDMVGVSTVSAQSTWGLLSVSSPLGIRVVRLTQIGTDPVYVYDDLGFRPVPAPGAAVVIAGAIGIGMSRRNRAR